MKKIIFIFVFLLIDLFLSQLFLLKILEKDIIGANKETFENRVYNENYNYTFKKLVNFKSQYDGNIYSISTNDLGFREETSKTLDRTKTFSIIIGDSFIEGVGLNYEDTIVGMLNNKLENNNFKFLNAGVASYSSYIYLRKIQNIIDANIDLKIRDIIVFLDKSDVNDDDRFLNKPNKFNNTKGNFINQRKLDFYKDLKELSFWRFISKQTISGKILKLTTDTIENIISNISKRFLISKKFKKSFFEVNNLEVRAIKSINNKPFIKNWYAEEIWQKKTKRNIQFSVENLHELKIFLKKKNINLTVALYPWSFEIDDGNIRKKYLNFIIPLLNKNEIKYLSIYDDFLNGNIYENIGKNYLYNDVHFNKHGNKIISSNLIKHLSK